MMRQYELVERVTSYDPDANEDLLNRAYVYAMKAHGQQTRASGDPYFTHPLEVAAILTELKLDDATIVAALLHDVVEDTGSTQLEITELFGNEISSLVDGLTKIAKLDLMSKEAAQAKNLRKLLLAISRDVRVLLIKLADRLHNMRTLEHMRADKRRRIAQETLDIYSPLAGRMGLHGIREELENIAFKELHPEAYSTITKRLESLREESGDILAEIAQTLREELAAHDIEARVTGREKRPYSIWRKMEKRNFTLSQLSDIFGFRIIVNTVDECYLALGKAHQTWRVVPGRFKDYISLPKQNDYQSIHTIILGPHHMRVELQIRTAAMHEIAERGVAAHGFYKDARGAGEADRGVLVARAESNAYRWLRQMVEFLEEGENPKEFLEHARMELFFDQVFCFTPKGAVVALPKGANAIDFAYAVHTDVGNSCVGCRINGAHTPLMNVLKNGDEVDIIRSEAQTPPAAWESLVVTGKARSAIRRASRMQVRAQYTGLGREMLDRALEQHNIVYSDKAVKEALPRLGVADLEDVLAMVGRGELATGDVLRAMGATGDAGKKTTGKKAAGHSKPLSRRKNGQQSIHVRGVKRDLPINISTATGAVPGERIVGILTPGEGITIYPIFASALRDFEDEPERWIDLAWDTGQHDVLYPARIKVVLHNEVGALAQLTKVVGDHGGNIEHLRMDTRASDFYDLDMVLEVADLKHLNQITADLLVKPLVRTVSRVTD